MKTKELRAAIRRGKYAWPGGYPLFAITRDGAALCFDCLKSEWANVVWDIKHDCSTGWLVEGVDTNWEDPALYCDHCAERIESAYAEGD